MTLDLHPRRRLTSETLGAHASLDPAASEFYADGQYIFKKSDGSKRDAAGMTAFYQDLCQKYPIASIEDGLAEDDWAGWKYITEAMAGGNRPECGNR